MSTVAGPYGLRPVKLLGDLPQSAGTHTLPLTMNQTKGLFFGDPVGLIGGQPVPLTATPTTAATANSPVGVFMGCSFQDPIRGFVNAQFLGANAISNGATNVRIKIADWPYYVFQVQADGPVTLAQIGLNASLNIPAGGGSLVTGNSLVSLNSASIAVTATLAVRIYDFVYDAAPSPGASSKPGDAFTDVLVLWNFGVQRYLQSLGQ
jgi:hypothetical protein